MTQSFIQLPSDAANTGKQLQTFDNTILANDVYAEAVVLVNSAGIEEGTSGNPVRIDPVGTTIQPVSVPNPVVIDGDGTSNTSSQVWNTSTGTLGANVVLINGTFNYNFLIVTLSTTTTITAGALQFDVSNDGSTWISFSGFKLNSSLISTLSLTANTNTALSFNISGWQFFRVRVSTAILGTGQLTVGMAASSNGQMFNYAGLNLFDTSIKVATNNGAAAADAVSACAQDNVTAGANCIQSVAMSVYTSASSSSTVLVRTPAIFHNASVPATASGNTAVWTPTSGKKFRLMRFQITAQGLSATSATLLTISFQDSTTNIPIGTYDVLLPTVANLVSGITTVSAWVDLGHGVLSAAANNVLNANISATVTGATGTFRVNVCGTEE